MREDYDLYDETLEQVLMETSCSTIEELEDFFEKDNLPKSWMYDKRYGIFAVSYGRHNLVAEHLLELGGVNTQNMNPMSMCEHWLKNFKHTCYKSTFSKDVLTVKGNLDEVEMSYFIENYKIMEI